MTIDWGSFTPLSSLGGGILIGLAAGMLILLSGRIAGISGIVGGLFRPAAGEIGWRLAFLAGLLASASVLSLLGIFPAIRLAANDGLLVFAGLLVGVGTRYGAGCTSGHGVCGLARLSKRSAVAVLVFMLAGFVTVFLLRHI